MFVQMQLFRCQNSSTVATDFLTTERLKPKTAAKLGMDNQNTGIENIEADPAKIRFNHILLLPVICLCCLALLLLDQQVELLSIRAGYLSTKEVSTIGAPNSLLPIA